MAEDVRVKLWLDGGRRFAAQVREGAREVRKLGREFVQTNRDARGASNGLRLVQRVIGLIKPAALIAGLGLAAVGLSAVAVAGISVVSALGPMVGVLAPAAAGMVALKTSMGLVKVAGMGVGASFDGMFDAFQKQTPATNALARTVKGLVPQLLTLKNAVQGRILGGVIDGVKSASPLIAKLSPAIKQTASVLGGLAREAGTVAAGLGGPLSRILMTNAGLIRNVGRAGLNIAQVFVHVLDAARPLTAWLGRMALGWSQSLLASTKAGKESGRLTAFFERTQAVLSRVFSIVGNLARGLMGVGRAASGMGGDLLKSVDGASARFATFTASVGGQRQLRQFFADAQPVIRQTFGLIGDILGAFARLSVGANGGLAPLIAKLRDVVPVLERVLIGTTAAFGPALVDLVVAFAQAFEPLAGSSGPLVLFVQGLTALARVSAWVATSVPGGSAAITALFGALAVSQAVGLASFASGLFGAGRAVRALTVATTSLTAAQASQMGTLALLKAMWVALKASTIGQAIAQSSVAVTARAMWAAMLGPVGLAIAGIAALGAVFYLAYQKVGWFRAGVDAAFGAVKTATATVVGFVRDRFGSLVGFLTGIPGRIAGLGGRMFSGLANAASRVVSAIADRFRQLIDFVKRVPGAIADVIKSAPGAVGDVISGAAGALGGAVGLASGATVAQPGWAVVGERGPELLRLPGASTVFDAGQTAMALPSPAAIRSPRVRTRENDGDAQRVEVRVRHEPIPVTFRDEVIGEATGRAVTTYTARKR